MSSDRFAQRRRASKWQRIRRYVYAVAAIALVALIIWIIWWSNVLSVRTVEIAGETSLKPAVIRTAAQVRIGEPLARTDSAAIEKRVETLKRVESAAVGRSWPHTISIDVVERTAVGWVLNGGENEALDRHGVLFRSYKSPPKNLVQVKIGTDNIKVRERSLEEVAAVLYAINNRDPALFKKIQGVSADSIDSVTLNLTKGRIIRWGSAGETKAKLAVLDALLKIKARTYDVSAPEQPTTRR